MQWQKIKAKTNTAVRLRENESRLQTETEENKEIIATLKCNKKYPNSIFYHINFIAFLKKRVLLLIFLLVMLCTEFNM